MDTVTTVLCPYRINAVTYAISYAWSSTLTDQVGNASFPQDLVTRNSNPLWKAKVLAGVDATSAYFRTSTSFIGFPATATAEKSAIDTGVRATCLWNTPHGFAWQTSDMDAVLLDQAVSRVKRKINNASQSYQLLVPLAEIRELRGTIKQAIGLATETVIALSRIKRTGGRSAWKHAQKTWLGFSFGVKPLMGDIAGLASSIDAWLKRKAHTDRVVGTASKEWVSSWDDGIFASALLVQCTAKAIQQHSLSYRIIAGWDFTVQASNDYTAAQHFGVTTRALVPAAWELLAFSWLVDYFTTVGAWLDDEFIGQAGQSKYIVQCRRYRFKSFADVKYELSDPAALMLANHPGFSKMERYVFERLPLQALPARLLRFKTLDEVGINQLNRLLNLIALTGHRGSH